MDEDLLQYYAKEWDRYTTGANYINRLFTYLNRHWVKREKDEGRKGVYTVYTVRIYIFTPPTLLLMNFPARISTMETKLL